MSYLLYANQAESTLAGAISPSSTVANLAAGTGALFPSPNPAVGSSFYLTFNDAATGLLTEIVLVTARSTDQITIERGQQGTTAQSWNVNDLANQLPTAADLQGFMQAQDLQQQAVNYAPDTGSGNTVVIALDPVPVAITAGFVIRVKKSGSANTAGVVIDITDVGSFPLVLPGGGAVNNGQLVANGIFTAVADGAGNFVLQSGGVSGLGTAAFKAASSTTAPNLASIVGSVAVGDFAVFADPNGSIKDGGAPGQAAFKNVTNNALPKVPSLASGAYTVGDMAVFTDPNGTIGDGGPPPVAATQAQMIAAALATGVFATPALMPFSPFVPKGIINFYWNGSAIVVLGSVNMAGAGVRMSTGKYQFSVNYSITSFMGCVGTAEFNNSDDNSQLDIGCDRSSSNTIIVNFSLPSEGSTATPYDPDYNCILVFFGV